MGKQIGNALMVDRLRVGNSSCSALQEKTEKQKNRKTEKEKKRETEKEKKRKTNHGHKRENQKNRSWTQWPDEQQPVKKLQE
jgi:hypothetical protein